MANLFFSIWQVYNKEYLSDVTKICQRLKFFPQWQKNFKSGHTVCQGLNILEAVREHSP